MSLARKALMVEIVAGTMSRPPEEEEMLGWMKKSVASDLSDGIRGVGG